ncbi:hypothetical protein EVC62_09945 [Salinicola endophyticus]|uniref:Uncharacterized protein n=1 Tax=Salinicola endophyticus TaxID=1949083 RepID=A0ABY8FG52_9GAMM|nr:MULTISPECIES: hypothetical protein [Salinicola]WFF41794.1 hypothetical protein EVC62_09945 [Salinicola endophyticus]
MIVHSTPTMTTEREATISAELASKNGIAGLFRDFSIRKYHQDEYRMNRALMQAAGREERLKFNKK